MSSAISQLQGIQTTTVVMFQILNLIWIFSQTYVSGGVFQNILASIILDACKVSILNYL